MTRSVPPPARSRRVERALVHPGKVFWPDEGYTKRDLAELYVRVFPRLRAFVRDRLLTLERCPDGMRGDCFYQRQAPSSLPVGIPTKRVRDKTGSTVYVVGGRLATQLELVTQGCIAVHVWNSRATAPRRPDWVCVDVDPTSERFADAARAGLLVKGALDELRLESFPKTSGSRGLHVFVPIPPGPDTADVLAFAEAFVRVLAARHPKTLTVEARISARQRRVYLDPFRNGFGQTVVAPYSVLHRPRAPVSTPLDWSEVAPNLNPAGFNLQSVLKRLEAPDPWQGFFRRAQALPRPEDLAGG
ncbi:MAG TPA: non-homologous end-joining DNA ligase [bacterium]|nr:non-homologous end-joining DNA ligase [bacterium]